MTQSICVFILSLQYIFQQENYLETIKTFPRIKRLFLQVGLRDLIQPFAKVLLLQKLFELVSREFIPELQRYNDINKGKRYWSLILLLKLNQKQFSEESDSHA